MAKSPIAAGEEEQDGQATTASPPRTASKVITQQQQQHPSHPRPPLRNFFFFFLPYCAFLIYTSLVSHYTLPTPQTALYDAQTNLPQFSEAKALEYIHHYSEVIGYRILGTPEMDTTIAYTLQVVEQLKAQRTNDNIEFEISHQKGDGHHLFEFMGKKVWKKYLGIENVVVRLSNGTPSGKENAILISAHLDSTLPSPGASDDAAGIAVMLETVRVLSQTPDLLMNTALVFLFNGAEESLQDASHLFITQHEWRHTLRGAINLEACGSAGAETLFQATSSQMLELYSHVPRPMGSIFAPELFATGLLLSDTDFRQFEQYGGLTGLDIAIVKDSYKYHTRLDLVEYIEPGTLQHFGDNVIAMLTAGAAKNPELFNGIKKARETMYFTVLGGTFLIMAKAGTVTLIYSAISALAVLLAVSTVKKEHRGAYLLAVLNAPVTMISGIVMADVAAAVMSIFLGKPLAYFRKEWYCVLLYGGPAVLGMLLPQLILSRILRNKRYLLTEPNLLEHASLMGQLIFTASAALAGQLAGVLSSYVFALAASSLLLSLVVNDFLLPTITSRRGPLHSASYYIGQALPLIAGAEGLVSFLDVIVPLTGRTGVDAPSDFIIASLVAGVLYLVLPMLPSLAHRWDTRLLSQAMIGIVFTSGMIIAIFAAPSWQPFDAMHPKRLLCLYMENTTSNSFSLHVAGLDPSPLEQIVTSIATEMQLSEKPVHSDISDDIAEWDIIYPVSQFLHSYKVPLPASIVSASSPYKDSFRVEVLDSRLNAVSQTRSLQLAIQHPGIIWTVIAFDADVLKWDLPEPAERGMIRHHVKEASGHNVSTWHLNMELKLSNEQFQAALRQSQRRKGQRRRDAEAEEIDHALGGLRIEFSGLDVSRMWHHKVNEDRKGMEFVESLDKAMPDWVDASESFLLFLAILLMCPALADGIGSFNLHFILPQFPVLLTAIAGVAVV